VTTAIRTTRLIDHEVVYACHDPFGNRGITIDVATGREPSDGYAYAPSRDSERTFEVESFGLADVAQFRRDNDALLQLPGAHLGAWVWNGVVYLDVSVVGPASADTIRAAQDAQQIAVYDLRGGCDIVVGERTPSGYRPLAVAA
jgi:hypothetical protein